MHACSLAHMLSRPRALSATLTRTLEGGGGVELLGIVAADQHVVKADDAQERHKCHFEDLKVPMLWDGAPPSTAQSVHQSAHHIRISSTASQTTSRGTVIEALPETSGGGNRVTLMWKSLYSSSRRIRKGWESCAPEHGMGWGITREWDTTSDCKHQPTPHTHGHQVASAYAACVGDIDCVRNGPT